MLSLLRLYVYTLLQNYQERVSRRHFGMINYTKSCWKWLLTTLSREKIHGKSAWKRLINFVCWQTTSTSAILNAKSEVKWSNWQVTQNHKTIEYFVCFVSLWQAVCNWWNLEVEIPCLYTQSANGCTRVSTTTLPRLLSWWTSAWQAILLESCR